MFCVHCLLKRMLGVVFWTCISVGDSFIGYSIFSWLFYYLLTAVYWNLQLQLRICQFLLLCLPTFDTKYFGVLSRFSRVPLCVTPWTVACQAPLSTGFSKARILECIVMSSSRGSSWPRDQPWYSLHLLPHSQILYCWATQEAHQVYWSHVIR